MKEVSMRKWNKFSLSWIDSELLDNLLGFCTVMFDETDYKRYIEYNFCIDPFTIHIDTFNLTEFVDKLKAENLYSCIETISLAYQEDYIVISIICKKQGTPGYIGQIYSCVVKFLMFLKSMRQQ